MTKCFMIFQHVFREEQSVAVMLHAEEPVFVIRERTGRHPGAVPKYSAWHFLSHLEMPLHRIL